MKQLCMCQKRLPKHCAPDQAVSNGSWNLDGDFMACMRENMKKKQYVVT